MNARKLNAISIQSYKELDFGTLHQDWHREYEAFQLKTTTFVKTNKQLFLKELDNSAVNNIARKRLELTPLRAILRSAISGLEVNGWLYLPKNESWHINTPGIIVDYREFDDEDFTPDGELRAALEQGLESTLDSPTIEESQKALGSSVSQ